MDIEQSEQKFTVLPQRPGLNMNEIIFVDLDNDGKDDLFIGGDASYGGDDVAAFFLLLSHQVRPENSPFDLSTRNADRRYDATAAGDFNDCTRLAKGDWNADGREDLAIAGSAAGPGRRGGAYIIFGSDTLQTGTEQILGPDSVDVYLYGDGNSAYLGKQIRTADVNGDGRDDLLIAASETLYILLGDPDFKGLHHDKPVSETSADVTYRSWGAATLGVGDVNQDGLDDLFYGAGNTNRIYFAETTYAPHAVIDAASPKPDVTTLNYGGWTGPPSFSCTDFNGDGQKDFIIVDDGSFKTLWGRQDWQSPTTFDLATSFGVHVVYTGYYGGDQTDVADLNSDGLGDIAVGDDHTGMIHVILGRDFECGSVWDIANGLRKDDILLKNGGYHFATNVRFGDVEGSGSFQIGSGAWAEGPNYAGVIHVCFMRPDLHDVSLEPTTPTSTQNIELTYSSSWEEGQDVQVRWLVNEEEIPGQSGLLLESNYYARGDIVRAEVHATLSEVAGAETTTVSVSAAVANTPPPAPASVGILPEEPRADQTLTASAIAAEDRDDDPVSLRYEWRVNGLPTGTSTTLASTFFKAGDEVTLTVRCWDGTDIGEPKSAAVRIRNSLDAVNNANITAVQMPESVNLGTGFWIRVTVANTGSSAWSQETGFHMTTGAPSPSELLPGRIVKPGEIYEFSGYCEGFDESGPYTFVFQMSQEGSGDFGNRMARDILVGQVDGAHVKTVEMPDKVGTGKGFEIRVTVANTGTTTWDLASGYHLTTGLSTPSRLQLGKSVAPGETYQFVGSCPGLPAIGIRTLSFQMERQGVGAFGNLVERDVTIVREGYPESIGYWLLR